MTDPEDPWTFDDGYLDTLSPRNQERFEDEFDDNLDEYDLSAIERELSITYDKEEELLKLLKSAAACFHPTEGAGRDGSGFRFVGVNPLVSVRETAADAFLFRPEYNGVYVTIISCEIGGENRSEWVENVNGMRRFYETPEHHDRLKDQLGLDDLDLSFQYVTLTRPDDTVEMDFSVLNRRCDADNYAVWVADVEDKWMEHEAGRYVHPDLEDVFTDELDYLRREDPIDYAIGTHPVFPLQSVVFRIVKEKFEFNDDHKSEFTRDTFYDHFEHGLQVQCKDKPRREVVDSEVNRLLDIGLKTRVFSEDDDDLRTERGYRIMYSGTRGPDRAEKMVKPKYDSNIPAVEQGKRAYWKTRDEFDPESNLRDYGA